MYGPSGQHTERRGIRNSFSWVYFSVLFHLQEHFQEYCLIRKARRPHFSPCLTRENPGGIVLTRSGSDLLVKSQGSGVITPAQTSASGQIMSGVKVWHASLLGPWGGEPLNWACMRTLSHVCVRGSWTMFLWSSCQFFFFLLWRFPCFHRWETSEAYTGSGL